MFKKGLIMVVVLMSINTVSALTIDLLDNTDTCEYNEHLDLDHCFSKYYICPEASETLKINDINFVYREPGKEYLTLDNFGDKLDTEIEMEKKDDCIEVSITGYKNPFIDVDNVPCVNDQCFYQYSWWNSTYAYRYQCITDRSTDGIAYCNGTSGINEHIMVYQNTTSTTFAVCTVSNCTSGDVVIINSTYDRVRFENRTGRTGHEQDQLWYDVQACASYNMRDDSGTTYDSTANSIDCTNTIVGENAGLFGGALEYDGAGDADRSNCASPGACTFTNGLTVSAFVKQNDLNDEGILISAGNNGARNIYVIIEDAASGQSMYANIYTDAGSQECYSADGYINDNNYHHVVVLHNGSHTVMYIDGVNRGFCARTGTPLTWTDNIHIGNWYSNVWGFDGDIDEVTIYNVTLTDQQIIDLNNSRRDYLGDEAVYEEPAANVTAVPGDIEPFIILKGFSLWDLIFNNIIKAVIVYVEDIIISDDVFVTGNISQSDGNATINMIFGDMYGNDISNTTLGGQGVYTPIQNYNGSLTNGVEFSNDNLTIQVNGTYKISASISFSGKANNEYHIAMGIDGTRDINCHAERKIGTGGDVGSAAFTCIKPLNESHVISLMVENTDSSTAPQIHDINFNLLRIGHNEY